MLKPPFLANFFVTSRIFSCAVLVYSLAQNSLVPSPCQSIRRSAGRTSSKKGGFKKLGFTLIEILVVIGIVSVISSIVAVSLFNYRDRAALRVETGRVVALINETREQSVAGRGGVVHGLHIEAAQIVRFSGTAYVADATGNEPLELSSLVDIGSISLTGGASDVVFSRLSGKPNKTGTFRVRLKSDVSNYKEVKIESTGIATVQ